MLTKVNFSITQLEYVMAVHKFGHFAKAAEACFVTQPTLSMQIQKLEEDLGVVIFDRSKKPILVTEKGAEIIEQVQTILFEVKKIESIIKKSSSLDGVLNVGIIPTVAPYLLHRLLPQMQKKYPDIKLNLKELQTHQIVDALMHDELDVGILAIPLKENKIIEKSLYYEPFMVLAQKNHKYSSFKKIKYKDLNQDDIWLLEEGHCLRHQVIDICSAKKNLDRKYQFESGSLETLKNLVNNYGGYTLLPYLAIQNMSRNSILIPFEKPTPGREIGVVYRREHYKTEFIEALSEAIQSCVPEELKKFRDKDIDVIPISN